MPWLPVLNARWQLTPAGAGWRLTAQALELGDATLRGPAQLSFDEHAAHATLMAVQVGALAALTHWWAPQAPLEQLLLSGRARTLEFDWDARRPAGARWLAAADLDGLTLASAAGDVTLSGLSAHLRAQEAQLTGEFSAPAARLVARRETPLTLEELRLQGHLAAALEGMGWRLSSEDFECSAGAAHIEGRIGLDATAAPARLEGHVQLRETDVPTLAALLGPGALRALGLGATHLTADASRRGVRVARRPRADGEFLAGDGCTAPRAARRGAGRRRAWPGLAGSPRASTGTARRCARTSPRRKAARLRPRRAGAVGHPWPARAARQRISRACPGGARVAA